MPRETVLWLPPSPEPPPSDPATLAVAAARALGLPPDAVVAARLRRLSFDARPRRRRWRLAVTAWLRGEEVPPAPATTPPTFPRPAPSAAHVVVVGSGPAGLVCALDCLAAGLRVTVVERGQDVRTRRRALAAVNRGEAADPDSNYCFGEGGAGTYSDGKLYTRTGARADVEAFLALLVAHGAPAEILASWRPHVGSNRLPRVVQALRETILRSGGAVRFGTRAEAIATAARAGRRRVVGVDVRTLATGAVERLACDALVLATGHSARDAVAMAARAGARLVPKGFAMGVRIEHPQAWVDACQYGGLRNAAALPAAFYELATRADARGVYSFCMCPGGFIVPAATEPDGVVVNGMSLARRDSPFASAGIVVQVEPEDWCGAEGARWGWDRLVGPLPERPDVEPAFGLRLQRALEAAAARAGGGRNRAPAERVDAFVERAGAPPPPRRTSYRPGVTAVDLGTVLPPGLAARLRAGVVAFDRRLPGFAGATGQLVGVESRTSSPVRLVRDPETLACPDVDGLHPCGEGAGWAGGIVSAALDGRRVAAALRARHST